MFQQKSSLLQFTSPNFIQVDSNFRLWFLAMILNCGSDHWHKNDRHLSSRLQIKHWILLHMKQIQWIPSSNQLSMLQVDWVAVKFVLLWKQKEFSKLHPPWPHRNSQAKSPWQSSLLRPLAQRNRPGTIASALGFFFFSLVAFSQLHCAVWLWPKLGSSLNRKHPVVGLHKHGRAAHKIYPLPCLFLHLR